MLANYKLIQEDSVLIAQPLLIQHYGRVGALLIQQIYYWTQKGQGVLHNDQRWIHNTAEQWAEQLCVSARTIKRTVHRLVKDGAIRVLKLAKHKSNQTNSYTLNHERLKEIIAKRDEGEENPVQHFSNNGTKPHRDILSSSQGHSVPMVIQKLTNKNKTNKSGNFVPQDIESMIGEEKKIATPVITNDGAGEAKKIGTTAHDMVDIWNKEVSLNKRTNNIKLNCAISKYLVASFKYRFNEDLSAWKDFCRLITSSPYLMGQGFNLSLTWALKFGTIDRILAGELGVGLRPVAEKSKTLEEVHSQALARIEGGGESDGCKQTRYMILQALGPTQYNAWFTQVDILDDGKTLKARSRFVEDYITTHFGHVIERVK